MARLPAAMAPFTLFTCIYVILLSMVGLSSGAPTMRRGQSTRSPKLRSPARSPFPPLKGQGDKVPSADVVSAFFKRMSVPNSTIFWSGKCTAATLKLYAQTAGLGDRAIHSLKEPFLSTIAEWNRLALTDRVDGPKMGQRWMAAMVNEARGTVHHVKCLPGKIPDYTSWRNDEEPFVRANLHVTQIIYATRLSDKSQDKEDKVILTMPRDEAPKPVP